LLPIIMRRALETLLFLFCVFDARAEGSPVYPPLFVSPPTSVSAPEASAFTLSLTVHGTDPTFQWYRRPLNNLGSMAPLEGQTNSFLNFPNITASDLAEYGLLAQNSKGSLTHWVTFTPILKPSFQGPPGGYQGPAGQFIYLTLADGLARGNEFTRIEWYKDGTLVSSNYSAYGLTVGPATFGSYVAIVANAAGAATSPPAQVTITNLTAASSRWTFVADTNTLIPNLAAERFKVFTDIKLKSGRVTFLGSSVSTNEALGLYQWRNGQLSKIIDYNDVLPPIQVKADWLRGPSEFESGAISFSAGTTNYSSSSSGVYYQESGVFTWQDGTIQPIATTLTTMPGTNLTFSGFDSTARTLGKTVFHGYATFPIFRYTGFLHGVYVWDGAILVPWVESWSPSYSSDFDWFLPSMAFDGTTLLLQGGYIRRAIYKSVNAGPLEKIVAEGNSIPELGASIKSIFLNLILRDGKVLFLAEANEFPGNVLLELSNNTLKVIAKAGSATTSGFIFNGVMPSFDYGADGSIIFSARGSSGRQGICQWRNGVITELIGTLNTLNGQRISNISLQDTDGPDLLANIGFGAAAPGLYLSLMPRLEFSVANTTITLQHSPNQVIQQSTNLLDWADLPTQPSSITISPTDHTLNFYRLVEP
jgi:hypothetical protein